MVIERVVGSDFVLDNIHEPSIFHFKILSFENGYHAPRLGDIWIPFLDIIRYNYVRFCMHGMEIIFKVGDKIIKVEHFSIVSKMSNWKLDFLNKWIGETLETIDFAMGLDQKGISIDLHT
jgi:hypothetical protein